MCIWVLECLKPRGVRSTEHVITDYREAPDMVAGNQTQTLWKCIKSWAIYFAYLWWTIKKEENTIIFSYVSKYKNEEFLVIEKKISKCNIIPRSRSWLNSHLIFVDMRNVYSEQWHPKHNLTDVCHTWRTQMLSMKLMKF